MKKCDIFVFAGEPSGDIHGAKILQALNQHYPQLNIVGVCGPLMRKCRVDCFKKMEHFQVMGFSAVIKALPKLIYSFFQIRSQILKLKPKAVLFIDYPGFNLRMATSLRKKGYKGKIMQYICPTVWAHGKKRIDIMLKSLDHVFAIFPFEPKFLEPYPLKVTYIGHPLAEGIENVHESKVVKDGLKRIGLFPGSRTAEIELNFPKQLQAIQELKQTHPNIVAYLSIAHHKFQPMIKRYLLKTSLKEGQDIHFVYGKERFELMNQLDAAIATSGTVTLELALRKVPTVVVYHVTFVNWLFARFILKLNLDFYCIVNIILKKEAFPELLHKNFTTNAVVKTLKGFLDDSKKHRDCQKLCKHMIELIQTQEAPSEKTSHLIAEEIYA